MININMHLLGSLHTRYVASKQHENEWMKMLRGETLQIDMTQICNRNMGNDLMKKLWQNTHMQRMQLRDNYN